MYLVLRSQIRSASFVGRDEETRLTVADAAEAVAVPVVDVEDGFLFQDAMQREVDLDLEAEGEGGGEASESGQVITECCLVALEIRPVPLESILQVLG